MRKPTEIGGFTDGKWSKLLTTFCFYLALCAKWAKWVILRLLLPG